MNIFVTSGSPAASARYLDNKRLVKMVLETGQLLSTALHLRGEGAAGLYKPTHPHHPCTKWAAASEKNLAWLREYFVHLANEYTARFGREHLTFTKLWPILKDYDWQYELMRAEDFVDVSGVEDDNLNVFEKYRICLQRKWDNDKMKLRGGKSMSDELKPCPFCGGASFRCDDLEENTARCMFCLAEGHVDKWNTRPIEDKLREENERLKTETGIDMVEEQLNIAKRKLQRAIEALEKLHRMNAWDREQVNLVNETLREIKGE